MKYGKWYHASPSFINLSIDADICNRASMFRSLQENACIVSAINLKKIEDFTGITVKEIVFAGGASRGALWSQILADITGCVVKIPKVTEATALGTAMSAGVGAGVYNSLVDASFQLIVWEKEYLPNRLNFDKYNIIQQKWCEIYNAQLALVDRGLTESMWKSPGL
jgi:autoinducer 2 (AI-2) kinase